MILFMKLVDGEMVSTRWSIFKWIYKKTIIQTPNYKREFLFSEDKRNKDYLLLTPLNKNEYERQVEYNDSIKLERPRVTGSITK